MHDGRNAAPEADYTLAKTTQRMRDLRARKDGSLIASNAMPRDNE
jgi:hypothetical protein